LDFELKNDYEIHLKKHNDKMLNLINYESIETSSNDYSNKTKNENMYDSSKLIPITVICFGLYVY
jgi:hypothetical protein